MNEDDTFDALLRPPTEDQKHFGRKKWVYCAQHMRPHPTGWCTVSISDKVALDSTSYEDAVAECTGRGLPLYKG